MGLVRRPWPLVGRGEELALMDERLAGAARATVVAGAVGVGKSRLLGGWLTGLAAQGRPAVVVRATRATATVPFGAFARWVPERLGDTGDRLGVLRAVTAGLADEGDGLVVAVDDAQLLDDGSAALVLHLVQHTATGVLVTVRSGEPCPDAVVSLWKEGLAERLDLQPLSEPETAELVEQALGGAVAPGTRARLWHLTGGNPLYLREVVEAAQARGVLTRVAGVWRCDGRLAGSTRLVELVSERIAGCDAAGRRVLELVALGEPVPVDVVVDLADLDVLADLEGRGLVAVDRPSPGSPGGVVRSGHPLYAEVLRAELPAFTARGHHRALARAALAADLHGRDPLRVATWLVEGGEPAEPELLVRASRLAMIAQDCELSARLAQAAEAAGAGWRATLQRAEALGPLHRWDEFEAVLAGLAADGSEPEAQAAAARVRAEQAFWHRGQDLSVARAIMAEAVDRAPAHLRSRLLVYAARYAQIALDLEESIRLASEAAYQAGTVEDRIDAFTCAALVTVVQGRTSTARDMVRLVGPDVVARPESTPLAAGYTAFTYGFTAILGGRIDEAAAVFELLLDHDLARLGGPLRAFPAVWLAGVAEYQGRVRTAADLARQGLDLMGDSALGTGTWVAATLVSAAAQAGDEAAASSAVRWLDGRRRPVVPSDDLAVDGARAWWHACRGELSAARDMAHDVAARAAASRAWMMEATALLAAVRFEGGAGAADRLAELTGVVEGPLVAGAARFARSAADGDGPGLDEVAADFAAMGARLLAAEAAALAADVHAARGRRRRRAASLAAARRWAAHCEGAATPLLATLDRDPRAGALTGREREVAGMAARGRSSRQIAEALTISVRTVDSHLDHAYTKLGINDRANLASALGAADG